MMEVLYSAQGRNILYHGGDIMVEDIKKIQSLFGIGERGEKSSTNLRIGKKIFYKNGTWKWTPSSEETTYSIDSESIGMKLIPGAILEMWTITEISMSFSEFTFRFGIDPAVYSESEKKVVVNFSVPGLFSWIRISNGNVIINLGATVPEKILHSLLKEAFTYASRTNYGDRKYLLMAHPGWVFSNQGINLLVSNKPMTLENDVRIRAGKDIWNTPILTFASNKKPLMLKVLASTGTIEGDGNFIVTRKATSGYTGLVRGVIKTGGNLGILKGRILSTDMNSSLPDGSSLPSEADGWITTDNIKWLSKSAVESLVGKVIPIYYLIGVQDEDHEVQANGYKFHSLAMILMKMDDYTRTIMERDFRSMWVRSGLKMRAMTIEQMIAALKDDTNGFVLSSQAVKCLYGVGTPEDIRAVKASFAKKFLSRRLKGSEYPMIFFAKSWGGMEVTPDSPVWSPELFKRLSKNGTVKEVTLSRYPLVSYQSYLRVKLENTLDFCDIGLDYVVLHPDVAGYIQGDGDDHALVQSEYMSTFKPSSKELVKVTKPMFRTGEVDPILAYFKGAKAVGSIGVAFNAMIKGLASGDKTLAVESAMAINAFAQGVKKDAILPEACILASNNSFSKAYKKKPSDFIMNLALLISGKTDSSKFELAAFNLGFTFGLNIPKAYFKKEIEYSDKITTFVKAKSVMVELLTPALTEAGFGSISELKHAISKEATLWSVNDFVKVSSYFADYAEIANSFKGLTHYRESGLLASQLEGKYLAIFTLLNER